jgi:hypothetical protein
MSEGLDLIKRQQPEIIDGFPTGNIFIGVTKEELTELEKELEDLDTIKKIFADYGLSFKLTTLREAVFLLKQLQNEKSQCWDNALKKLKALEIIKKMPSSFRIKIIEQANDLDGSVNLLKEVLL